MRWTTLAVLLCAVGLGGCKGKAAAAEPADRSIGHALLEYQWGVHVESVRRTAGGLAIDFRYRVTDPDKAQPLFARKTEPYAIDQKSGTKLRVPRGPKIGPLRSRGGGVGGQVNYILFANPGPVVGPGDRIAVVVGEFRAENLQVE
jgi:hypothetical protein